MGGLGYALAGALSGFGAGMAEQGKLDLAQKHQIAMEKLRSANQMAESENTGRINATNKAAEQSRGFAFDVARDRGKSEADMRRDAANNGFKAGESALDRTHDIELARQKGIIDIYGDTYGTTYKAILEKSLANGEIKSVEQDDKGNFFVIKNDGSIGDIGVVGTPKSQTGLAGMGLQLGGGTPGKPAAAPANTGLNRRTTPAAPAAPKQPDNAVVPPTLSTAAAVKAWATNPANKGKPFIGPDGLMHTARGY